MEWNQLSEGIDDLVPGLTSTADVPGYVAAVWHDGREHVVTSGTANLNSDVPMRRETRFLLGSITKVLTTMLVLRQVERGRIGLADNVASLLPELKFRDQRAAELLTVRHLLNHTNGIDADSHLPAAPNGPDATRCYLESLGDVRTLFEPGRFASYSNAGFVVAGRILELVTGRDFNSLLRTELFPELGMATSCTSAEEAILFPTAVGHLRQGNELRAVDMFAYPPSAGAAGTTPIVTIDDLIAIGLAFVDGSSGHRPHYLAAEFTRLMSTPSHDQGVPNCPPVGLGWWLPKFGGVDVLWHAGGSPGGSAYAMVVPSQNLVFAAFGNGPAASVHDAIAAMILHEHLGIDLPDVLEASNPPTDLSPFIGAFQAFQVWSETHPVDGLLRASREYRPADENARRVGSGSGNESDPEWTTLRPVGPALFAPNTMNGPVRTLKERRSLVSFHDETDDGRFNLCMQGMRMHRRVSS